MEGWWTRLVVVVVTLTILDLHTQGMFKYETSGLGDTLRYISISETLLQSKTTPVLPCRNYYRNHGNALLFVVSDERNGTLYLSSTINRSGLLPEVELTRPRD